MNFGLPARAAAYSLKGPSYIRGDPFPLEATWLRFDSLALDVAIELAGVESKVIANFLEVCLRTGVTPVAFSLVTLPTRTDQ